jgi:hypothetical protein
VRPIKSKSRPVSTKKHLDKDGAPTALFTCLRLHILASRTIIRAGINATESVHIGANDENQNKDVSVDVCGLRDGVGGGIRCK